MDASMSDDLANEMSDESGDEVYIADEMEMDMGMGEIGDIAEEMAVSESGCLPRNSKRRWVIGIVLLLCVAVIWVASSTVVQIILTEQEFHQPFFLTYFSTSLFSVYLLGFLFSREWSQDAWPRVQPIEKSDDDDGKDDSSGEVEPLHDEEALLIQKNKKNSKNNIKNRNNNNNNNKNNNKNNSNNNNNNNNNNEQSDDHNIDLDKMRDNSRGNTTSNSRGYGKSTSSRDMGSNSSSEGKGDSHINSIHKSNIVDLDVVNALPHYTWRETAKLSLLFCPIWFLANFTYNASLELTSVTSNTIIVTSSTFFTLVIGSVAGTEHFTVGKLIAVFFCVGGVVLVTLVDKGSENPLTPQNTTIPPTHTYTFNTTVPTTPATPTTEDEGSHPLLGDLLALVSAITYGVYTTFLAKYIPDERRVSMPMFFGFVGIINFAMLWPVKLILHFSGVEEFILPELKVLLSLTINGMIGTVASDLIWSYALLLTNGLAASMCLSLTVPLAMVADIFRKDTTFPPLYILGSVCVVVGFIIVNLASRKRERELYRRVLTKKCSKSFNLWYKNYTLIKGTLGRIKGKIVNI